jgi:hypothetical protein
MAQVDKTSRRGSRRRAQPWLAAVAVLAVLIGGGVLLVLGLRGAAEGPPAAVWREGAGGGTSTPAVAATTSGPRTVTLSATGDIVLGDMPNRLPPNGGADFFGSVVEALAADLVMGNLEQPLTGDTGYVKCAEPDACHQFRAPPEYAQHLVDGGFHLLNQANNHGYDYGPEGYRNTQRALAEHGLAHTGAPGEITVVEVEGLRVAVIGFSPYSANNSLLDIDGGQELVRRADESADLVVIQVHMGAEGADRTRVTPGEEIFYGENRGDPIKFSRAMIDAGADLVVGHGPHVLRGMEFHRGRLIAYSLGNFAGGGGTLSANGRLGWGGVLKVTLTEDGSWVEGEFIATYMDGSGLPRPDDNRRGLDLVRELSAADFPETAASFDDAGRIAPSAD